MNAPDCFRLLVIDDNPSIHDDFTKILCPPRSAAALEAEEAALFDEAHPAAGTPRFEIDCALQGEEGVECARQAVSAGRPYALAFVDVRMPPGQDGVETVAQLWQDCPELQVVLCTAYSDYSWEDMTRRLGHSDNLVILKKPFDNIEVLQLAHALTRKWTLARQSRARLRPPRVAPARPACRRRPQHQRGRPVPAPNRHRARVCRGTAGDRR